MKKIIVSLLFLFGLTGCFEDKPDLDRLYHDNMMYPDTGKAYVQPPVIIIPGLGGSTLINEKGQLVWPGTNTSLIFSDYNKLALMIDDETLYSQSSAQKPDTLISEVLGTDIYGSLMRVLEDNADFKQARLGEKYSGKGRRYYLFPYDWRQKVFHTSKMLDKFIDQIRLDYGDPDLEVDLIGHSLGGLVARYYLKYGSAVINGRTTPEVTQAGAEKVRRVIQLGTPNLGATETIYRFVKGFKILNGEFSPETIATLPSIYELLPHPFVHWAADIRGKPLDIDVYSTETWERFQWGLYSPQLKQQLIDESENKAEAEIRLATLKAYFSRHLARAEQFHLSLSKPFDNPRYSIVAFGSNCTPTLAKIVFEEINGKLTPRFSARDIKYPRPGINYERLMYKPGDGAVTKPSLVARVDIDPSIPRMTDNFFPLDYAFFLCHRHLGLTGNVNFQDNLLNELLMR